MNLSTLAWDDDLCALFGVPKSILPEIRLVSFCDVVFFISSCPCYDACCGRVRSSSELYGCCVGGRLDGVPLAGILGDQQAALFGQSGFEKGDTKNTYGNVLSCVHECVRRSSHPPITPLFPATGTGAFAMLNTGTSPVTSKHGLLTTVAYQLCGQVRGLYSSESLFSRRH
jgi:glycerol kinase